MPRKPLDNRRAERTFAIPALAQQSGTVAHNCRAACTKSSEYTSVLQDNMVISIDIPLFEADGFGARTEDGFIICGDKAERLTNLERVIRK